MKNICLSVMLVLLTCAFSTAQDTPKAEVFLGYTYLRANSATNVPAFSTRYFTDNTRWAAWWGPGSTIDPRPGGPEN